MQGSLTSLLLLSLLVSYGHPQTFSWDTDNILKVAGGAATGLFLQGTPNIYNQGCQIVSWLTPQYFLETYFMTLPNLQSNPDWQDWTVFGLDAAAFGVHLFSTYSACVFNPPVYGYRTEVPRYQKLLSDKLVFRFDLEQLLMMIITGFFGWKSYIQYADGDAYEMGYWAGKGLGQLWTTISEIFLITI